MNLSVVIITHNEEANIARTLKSVQLFHKFRGNVEIIVVDSGSTDRTVEIAKSYGAKVFIEEWKGFAAQKNSAIEKAAGDWILSLDSDEEIEDRLRHAIHRLLTLNPERRKSGYWLRRKNFFLGKWIRHGGFWPDPKLRLFKRGTGKFENCLVHETVHVDGETGKLWHIKPIFQGALIHHSYPTLSDYIEHMNRYSSLGAEMVVAGDNNEVRFSVANIVLRPIFTFIYNYFFRLGFLDGREGLLLHLYHSVYVSWKYAKAWELSRKPSSSATNQ